MQSRQLERWLQSAGDLYLPDGEVHLWLAPLNAAAVDLEKWAGWLSVEERARADLYRSERDRNNFLARRGMLRELLIHYTRRQPDEITITLTLNKKPFLANSDIHFNLSSSGNWSLFGFSRAAPLGVDIEKMMDFAEIPAVVERFFSSAEQDAWKTLPAGQRKSGFYHGWTQKEAFLKALGRGMAFPGQDFDVVVDPDVAGEVLRVRGRMDLGWAMWTGEPVSGYRAAMAIKLAGPRIKTFNFFQS